MAERERKHTVRAVAADSARGRESSVQPPRGKDSPGLVPASAGPFLLPRRLRPDPGLVLNRARIGARHEVRRPATAPRWVYPDASARWLAADPRAREGPPAVCEWAVWPRPARSLFVAAALGTWPGSISIPAESGSRWRPGREAWSRSGRSKKANRSSWTATGGPVALLPSALTRAGWRRRGPTWECVCGHFPGTKPESPGFSICRRRHLESSRLRAREPLHRCGGDPGQSLRRAARRVASPPPLRLLREHDARSCSGVAERAAGRVGLRLWRGRKDAPRLGRRERWRESLPSPRNGGHRGPGGGRLRGERDQPVLHR